METPIRLIVGLGNPGSEYDLTRHNAGFMFVDELARSIGASFRSEQKFQGEVAKARISGEDVWLLKPSTYMNCSGRSVQAICQYFKISLDEIVVVHDELDLSPGTLKMKKGGGNAGHNGLKDISSKMGSPNFWRLRLGIGHPRTLGLAQQVADFVLSRPNSEQLRGLEDCINAALKTVPNWIEGDFAKAQRALKPFERIKAEKKE